MQHKLLQNFFYHLSPKRSRGCVKGQNICMHGVICFILNNMLMQQDYFQKRKQTNRLTPYQGSRISLRAKYLLTCYCKLLRPPKCKHVTSKVRPFFPQSHNLNKLRRGPQGDTTYQMSRLHTLWFQTKSIESLYRPMLNI